jgi:hypothetical protein
MNKKTPEAQNGRAQGPCDHKKEVRIAINGKHHEVREGLTRVEQLKTIGDIPATETLERDVYGQMEALIDDGEVHVHAGDVFVSRRQEHHMAKIHINGKEHETHRGENSVEHLKHLGQVPTEEVLAEIKEGKPVDLGHEAVVEIHGGEIFKSHKRLVKITINGNPHETQQGENSVAHLRHLGKAPADEILSEFINGQFVDLANNAHVEIHGGEIFASHKPSGGSS